LYYKISFLNRIAIFESFGETDRSVIYLDELQSIAEQATDRFSRFSTFQSRIANAQPPVPSDIIELVNRTIENTQQKIPALERSIQEIRQEGELS
jgi:predicted nucleotidyltransferase